MPVEWKEGLDRITLEWMRRGVKCYLAYFEAKPAGTCTLTSLMKTGGIFSVGTLKEYRRRGIGTTLKVHALMESLSEGDDLHTLQTAKRRICRGALQKDGICDRPYDFLVCEAL